MARALCPHGEKSRSRCPYCKAEQRQGQKAANAMYRAAEQPAAAALDEFISRYSAAPIRFVQEVLGITPDPWQRKVLAAYGRGDRRISVRSSHGPGKTATAAWIALHHLLFKFPQKTAVTAPSAPQLFDAFFAEVKRWMRVLPPAVQDWFEVKTDRIELKAAPESSFLSCRTSRADQSEALQGIHSDHVLLIADEASGIHEKVFEAATGSMSGHNAMTLLIGNPVRSHGLFHASHTKLRGMWTTFHVSAFDSPRVTLDYIEDMKRRYGENSNAYRIRVLGEFPLADDNTVIPFELVEAAAMRDITPSPTSPVVWGLDVARSGADRSALCKRRGPSVLSVSTYKLNDLMQLTGAIVAEYRATPTSEQPLEILVDVIGLGAGVLDRLRELGLPARGVNVAESPAMGERYRNLRAELYWTMREWFEGRACSIPNDDDLIAELTAPTYRYLSSGKLEVESKELMRARLPEVGSPDRSDALMLTFASTAVTAMWGSAGGRSQNQPLERHIAGIV